MNLKRFSHNVFIHYGNLYSYILVQSVTKFSKSKSPPHKKRL